MSWLTWENVGWFTLLSPVALWPFFLALFNIWPEFTMQKSGPVFWWIALIFGGLIDLYVNLIWGTVLFLQWPDYRRLLLSARMDDLILNGAGWRQRLAVLIVGHLLEPFDRTGQHSTYGMR